MIGLRRLRISSNLLTSFFLGGHPEYEVTENGLPVDARVVGLSHDLATGFIDITLASASWEGPLDGGRIPELPAIICDLPGAGK